MSSSAKPGRGVKERRDPSGQGRPVRPVRERGWGREKSGRGAIGIRPCPPRSPLPQEHALLARGDRIGDELPFLEGDGSPVGGGVGGHGMGWWRLRVWGRGWRWVSLLRRESNISCLRIKMKVRETLIFRWQWEGFGLISRSRPVRPEVVRRDGGCSSVAEPRIVIPLSRVRSPSATPPCSPAGSASDPVHGSCRGHHRIPLFQSRPPRRGPHPPEPGLRDETDPAGQPAPRIPGDAVIQLILTRNSSAVFRRKAKGRSRSAAAAWSRARLSVSSPTTSASAPISFSAKANSRAGGSSVPRISRTRSRHSPERSISMAVSMQRASSSSGLRFPDRGDPLPDRGKETRRANSRSASRRSPPRAPPIASSDRRAPTISSPSSRRCDGKASSSARDRAAARRGPRSAPRPKPCANGAGWRVPSGLKSGAR